MQFRSLANLNQTIIRNLHRLPDDIDIVVGIPRSGLLAASLVALALNKQLTDLEGFCAGRAFGAGRTRRHGALETQSSEFRRALIVDDSIRTGASLAQAQSIVQASGVTTPVSYLGVYGVPDQPASDVITFETVPEPRCFEWNAMHHSVLKHACVDIDGVLCLDPTEDENVDGPAYQGFLASARPLFTPTKPIGALVTNRLERDRAATERWLAARGIAYDRLIMRDLPSAAARRAVGQHGEFKAEVYKSSPARLFIESDPRQAETIARQTGKAVLCIETFHFYGVSHAFTAKRKAKGLARRILGEPLTRTIKRVLRPA